MTCSTCTYGFLKRTLDLVGASLLLLLLFPLLGLVAVGIWWEDGRPLLFTQLRAGRHGIPFRIYKFRTLETGPKDSTRPADYTTRIGAPLRRWAIDEWPQLWNVLRGDMSLVGPRPAPLDQVERYGTYERRRLHVRPGLTGWAQIHGRNAISWPTRIDYDIQYVQHRHLGWDLAILMWTPWILLRGTGVYGSNRQNESFSASSIDRHG